MYCMPAKKTTNVLDSVATSFGITYTVPHSTFDEDPPYDLSQATAWERQEIKHVWRDAQRYARTMMSCGIMWIDRLDQPALGYTDSLDASGDSIPTTVAQKLTVALVRLNGLLDGMHHRIVMMEKDS